ncbi:synaptobrevin [Sanghuangporus baumii]|uniref:Synaptobrevin n=1 Tax=Sanghuangporus baumii TaxID=108892 RepID=A0A9Q5I3G2_SANBA|nr:synaptobrevin [Sanghuangporus baumii]
MQIEQNVREVKTETPAGHVVVALNPALNNSLHTPYSRTTNDDNGQLYDPPMPRAGSSNEPGGPAASGGGDSRIDRLKNEVAEAQGVMRNNINLVREREDNLQNLQDKTAQSFRRGANKVRKNMWWKDMKNMWWKDMKMRIIIGIAIVIILIIIIVPIVKATT